MSEPKGSAETEEELDAVVRTGGFHLETSTLREPFLQFLREYGDEGVCIAKDVNRELVTLYAIVKLTKRKDITGSRMQQELRVFLSQYGVVNNCPCTLLSGGVMSISADIKKAERKSERLSVVRDRRSKRRRP